MKVLTRYLVRTHIGPFLFAFLALTSVLLINVLAKELANLAGKGLPVDVAFEYFVLSLPANIALTLPMAVLVAVLYTFSTLASDNEISALRASGVDLRRATLPLILLAALIAGGMAWFNDQVLPASNFRWRILMTDVAQTRPLLAIQSQSLNPISTSDGLTRYYLEAGDVDAANGRLWDVTIYDVADRNLSRTIQADSGRMMLNQSGTDLLLTLFDGTIREVNFNELESFQIINYERQVMRIEGVSDRLQRNLDSEYRTDRDMTSAMMLAAIDSLRVERATILAVTPPEDDAQAIGENAAADSPTADASDAVTPEVADTGAVLDVDSGPGTAAPDVDVALDAATYVASTEGTDQSGADETMSASPDPAEQPDPAEMTANATEAAAPSETDRFLKARVDNIDFQIRTYQLEIHKKFSIAVATLVFVLLGIPLALRFPRGGIGMVVAVSLGIFGIYYVGLIGGEEFGDRGYVSPAVAMWSTNFLFGLVGLIGFLKLGRETGTGRGSGWGEWPRLPRWLRRSKVQPETGGART